MAERIDLFNADNIAAESLSHFEIIDQVTVLGFGMLAGETVTFEMSEFDAVFTPPVCDPCSIPAVVFPTPSMYQVLRCADGTPITLSAARPVLVLNAPVGIRVRARYNGYAFSGTPLSSRVYAYESRPAAISAANSGCAACCI
jgi:hypothetical protein